MRASDIIRGVLDLIDQIDCVQQQQELPVVQDPIVPGSFKDMFAKLSGDTVSVYDNSPDVQIQGVAAVTTNAGLGGTNGPKNPADIKSNSISMFPAYQAEKK
jgi:hypothetical protein